MSKGMIVYLIQLFVSSLCLTAELIRVVFNNVSGLSPSWEIVLGIGAVLGAFNWLFLVVAILPVWQDYWYDIRHTFLARRACRIWNQLADKYKS